MCKKIFFSLVCFSTFAVKPAHALLKGNMQIFVVKISPKEVKTYKQKLTIKLNDNSKYDRVSSWYSSFPNNKT